MTAVPRLVLSAPSSGQGKTAVAIGLVAAYAGRGLSAAGFKIGPDHTDAAYLGLAGGRPGRNLDPRLVGAQRLVPLFGYGAAGADLAVVEGTMGLYDSLTGRAEADSTAGVAVALRAPVVLVLDVASMGQSVAAMVHGLRAFDELVRLGGVILNRVASERHEQLLCEALDDIAVPVFGALRPGDLSVPLPSRQHGMVPVLHRSVEATRTVRRLGEVVARNLDLDNLLALARSAPALGARPWSAADTVAGNGAVAVTDLLDHDDAQGQLPAVAHQPAVASQPVASQAVIADQAVVANQVAAADQAAVAGPVVVATPAVVVDSAAAGRQPDPGQPDSGQPAPGARRPVVAVTGGPGGTYSYAEHAELLAAAGAEVVPVDPLRDETLPPGTGALVIGGGLPESYAEELSANRPLSVAVADLARAGRPVIAEGTGLLWLLREFDGRPMCGVLPATGASGSRIVVGYRQATARAATVVAPLGARVVGYKHHAAVVEPRAGRTPAWTWRGSAPEGFVWRGVHASQLTVHWVGAPQIARRLVAAATPFAVPKAAGPPPAVPEAAGPPPAVPEAAGPPPAVREAAGPVGGGTGDAGTDGERAGTSTWPSEA